MLQGSCPSRTAPVFLLYTFPQASIPYGCFQRLSFSIGMRGIVTKLRGVPFKFFMRTPLNAPVVAIMNESKIMEFCVMTLPLLSNASMFLSGERKNVIAMALLTSVVSLWTILTFIEMVMRSSSILGFMACPICIETSSGLTP